MSGGPPSGPRFRWFCARATSAAGPGAPVDLVGVRRDAVAGVRRGDALRVAMTADGAVVCLNDAGEAVGALVAFAGLSDLIARLGAGQSYVARVEEASPTSCRVSVAEA